MENQINLGDVFKESIRYTKKSCGATWEVCTHKIGTCSEECCQSCNMQCSSRCEYSKQQPEVYAGKRWVANPDYIQKKEKKGEKNKRNV